MAILNLRSEEPAVDPSHEIGPDETPPGLEAIRAWLRKPRPWLQGVRLWIREFAKCYRAFREWARKNAVPAARRLADAAARGAEAARAVAKAGAIAGDVAKHFGDAGRALQNRDGRVGQFSRAVATRAGQVREFSARVVQSATSAAKAGDAVARLRGILPSRRKSENDPHAEEDDTRPARRLVPVTPRRTQQTVPGPPEAQRKPISESSEPERKTRPETPGVPPKPAPGPPAESRSRRQPSPPAGARKAETPDSSPPGPSPREVRHAEELAKLSVGLRVAIPRLRPRPRKESLRPIIVDVIRERGWTTSAELGLLLGVNHRNLARRHLRPMVEAGLLELRYPEVASHRYQAYRVMTEPPPAPGRGDGD
ncbi:MAG: hypothetical protein OXE58_03270 [Acidobacteria bacterium]|nr:hypothetical protein [Acidobacteriota bacterium]